MLAALTSFVAIGHTTSVSYPAGAVTTGSAYAGEPVANDDISENNVRGSVFVSLLDNDLLSSGSPVMLGTVTIDLDLSLPGDQPFLPVPGQGTWIILGPALTFLPDVALTGDPTPITYKITDVLTSLSDVATVTVRFLTVPLATADVSTNNTAGTAATILILGNDFLPNGAIPTPLDVSVDIDPVSPGNQSVLVVAGEGIWTYDGALGLLSFNPGPGLSGNPTPITYTLTDNSNGVSSPATVTVGYVAAPTDPTATDDTSIDNALGTPVTVQILSNDLSSAGGAFPPLIAIVDLDAVTPGGQPALVVAGEGLWLFDSFTGNLTFTPVPGFLGDPTPITYTLTDPATSLSDQATVTIKYLHELTATPDFSTNNTSGSTATVLILSNDFLADGTTPAAGDVTVDINPLAPGNQVSFPVLAEGTWAYDATTGILTFTPEPAFTGNPTPISYTLTDSANDVSDPAAVIVTYSGVLVATDDISNLNVPGMPAFILILANDLSSMGGPIVPLTTTVDLDASLMGNQTSLIVPGEGTWTYDGLLIVSFIPESGFTSDPTPITYTLTETVTGLSDQATITVQYLAPPVALPRNITIPTPAVDAKLALDGQSGHPAPLGGTDAQDGNMGTGHTFVVTNISGLNGNTLFYDNVPITAGPFTIANYDPSLLTIEFTGIGSMTLAFNYLITDTQGLSSPEVAYQLNWGSPLPVTLINFGAKVEGSQVVLSWTTSEESNSDHFEIQRSTDGVHWQSLGQQAAGGQSSTLRNYAFIDKHPMAGENVFRLKMVDVDRTYAYSALRSVHIAGGEKITMSPNPVSDVLTVDLPSWRDVSALNIYDQNGVKKGSAQPAAKAKIDVRKFQAGIYLIIIQYASGAVHSQRILIK